MAYATMTNKATGDLVTEADMDTIRSNIEYLLSPNKDDASSSGANYTITSTSWAKLDATTDLTVTTYGGPLLMFATMNVAHASSGYAHFDLAVDGTRIGNTTHGLVNQAVDAGNTVTAIGWAAPAAGSHTVSLYVKVSAGTATIGNTGSSFPPVRLWAIEL